MQRQVEEARQKAEEAKKLAEAEEAGEKNRAEEEAAAPQAVAPDAPSATQEAASAAKKEDDAAAAAKAAEEAKQKAEAEAAEAKQKADDEAKRQAAEAEAKQKQEAELKRKAEEDAKALRNESVKPVQKPPPEMLQGTLAKESTGGWFSSKKFDPKYVIIQDSKFSWWKDKGEATARKPATGVVDLGATDCEVVPDSASANRFMLRPKGTANAWVGTFSGAEKGREFSFDTEKSEHSCAAWVQALNTHIDYGHNR